MRNWYFLRSFEAKFRKKKTSLKKETIDRLSIIEISSVFYREKRKNTSHRGSTHVERVNSLVSQLALATKMSVYVMFGSLDNWYTRKLSKVPLLPEGVPQGCARTSFFLDSHLDQRPNTVAASKMLPRIAKLVLIHLSGCFKGGKKLLARQLASFFLRGIRQLFLPFLNILLFFLFNFARNFFKQFLFHLNAIYERMNKISCKFACEIHALQEFLRR